MPYFARSEVVKLFYTIHGEPSNPPFILIHGWACDSMDWSFTIPALIQKYHVITFDIRGHGHSSASKPASYTIQDFADDAVALLHHLNIHKDALVMGHSMGGIVASVLTAHHPSLFRGLTVIDPPYWRSTAFWADMLPKWDEIQNGFIFVTMAFGNQLPPILPPWLMTWYGIRAQAMSEHVISAALKGAYEPGMLGQMEVHRELVKGRTVPRLAVYMAEENVEHEKGLGVGEKDEIVLLADAGHWLHHIKPDEFNSILTKWLEKIESE